MEDVFGAIVVIIGIIASIVSSAKKKQQKTVTQYPPIVNTAPQQASSTAPPATSSMLPPRDEPAAPVQQPLQPQVHAHLQPDCDEHDKPGSLGVTSSEGKDPCHEEQLTAERTPLFTSDAEHSGLSLDWSGEAMVKAFVMQEVLTRPCQRRAR